jgi:hypothetical protein
VLDILVCSFDDGWQRTLNVNALLPCEEAADSVMGCGLVELQT